MKIVHIYKDYAPVLGGIENHVRDIAEAQASNGHQVTVIVNQLKGLRGTTETINGVRVVKVKRHLDVQSAPIGVTFPYHVWRETRGADIVHVHAPYPIGEACNLIFGREKKTVITWHSDIVRQKTLLRVYAPLLKMALNHAQRIIIGSQPYRDSSIWLKPHIKKTSIVPYGADLSRFEKQQPNAKLLDLKRDGKFVTLTVGRLRYYKGLDTLIRALKNLPEVIAVIVGIGPMAAEWKSLAQDIGVVSQIVWAGEVTDAELPSYFQAADVYVLPANSRAESYGIALVEALACGLPLVTTEVGSATSWINQDHVTGFVVAPESPPQLAHAIRTLQSQPNLIQKMRIAARARAEQEFSQALMLSRIEQIYREVAALS